jgi:enediyne polyketide synthase
MMRVYDARGAGFWPGEGCGFVVLMREEDARRRGLPIHACLAGWGISSDGAGGITRPEADGQRLALTRAWRRAGIGIEQAAAFEGHGTGTAVGDRTELSVLLSARRAGGGRVPAALSSIKANLGHTKAAAGIAGLLKAVLAARARLLPPATGWDTPHELLVSGDAPQHLRLLRAPEPWRDDAPLHIGVSAMGFGGINTHVVVSSTTSARARALAPDEALLARTAQDVELFLFAAPDAQGLQAQLNELAARAPELSLAELGDVAADFARRLQPGSARAAVVAATPGELVHGLQQAAAALAAHRLPRPRARRARAAQRRRAAAAVCRGGRGVFARRGVGRVGEPWR